MNEENKLVKNGDILLNNWGEYRIVTCVLGEDCYYIQWEKETGWFYNPCRACVSIKSMVKNRVKVGEITGEEFNDLCSDLGILIKRFNKVFQELDESFNQEERFNITRFLFPTKNDKN